VQQSCAQQSAEQVAALVERVSSVFVGALADNDTTETNTANANLIMIQILKRGRTKFGKRSDKFRGRRI
jgi:hypothetical protein